MRREPLREMFPRDLWVKALAAIYRDNPSRVAWFCDERLDPSGAILGEVRKAAQAVTMRRLNARDVTKAGNRYRENASRERDEHKHEPQP